MKQKTVYTIGHSNRMIEQFLELLASFEIQALVDVRQFPGSRKYPHFNQELLAGSLNAANITYHHIVDLGGRRKPAPDSANSTWKHPAFRAYADHMETEEFQIAINRLQEIASASKTVYMCSEAVWWSCHRSLISDYLKAANWKVLHIMSAPVAKEHPYTSPARIIDGKLTYRADI